MPGLAGKAAMVLGVKIFSSDDQGASSLQAQFQRHSIEIID
jgi:hypothetical protein